MMQRTTIVAPQALLDRLRRAADDRGVSLATVIREALEEKADKTLVKPQSVGIGDSGHTDIARRTTTERPIPRSWR
jgi:hypothetical protein